MASFVEQATLVVKDESTAQINKINAALKKLFATANSLKSIKVDIKVNDKGITQAIANINRLKSAMKGLGSQTVNIKANTGGLAAAQRQLTQMRQQAARGITGPRVGSSTWRTMPWGYAPAPPGRQPPAARAARGGRGGGAPPVDHEARGAFADYARSVIGGALREGGRAAIRYGYRSTVAGANDAAIADAQLKLQQLDRTGKPGDYDRAVETMKEVRAGQAARPGGTLYNPAQGQKLFSELLGVSTGDIKAAGVLQPYVEELARTSVLLGKSFQDAESDAIGYAKAVQQTGRGYTREDTFDPVTGGIIPKGSIDPAKMKATFDYFQKLQPEIGKEMTGDFANRIVKYLGKEKYAISDRGLGATLLMGEEYGTKAAVGMRQAVKQLGGQQVDKPQKKMLQQEGLLQNKEFQKMLTTDMPKAAHDFIAPLAKKHGLDLTDAAQANKLASMFVSNSTAQEALGAALYRSAEIQRQLDRAEARDPEQFRKDTAGNLRATMIGLDNAIQGVGGQAIQALAPVVTPQLQALTGAITNVAALTKEGKYGEAAIKVGEGLNAIAPLVAGGAVMKPLLTQAMSAMAPMMALKAVAAGDPMGGAAAALIGAAGDLSGAASALSMGAIGKGMPGGPNIPMMGGPIGAALAIGLQAQQFAAGIKANVPQLPPEYYTATPERQSQIRELMGAQQKLTEAIDKSRAFEEQVKDPNFGKVLSDKITGLFKTQEQVNAEIAAERKQNADAIKKLEQEVIRATNPDVLKKQAADAAAADAKAKALEIPTPRPFQQERAAVTKDKALDRERDAYRQSVNAAKDRTKQQIKDDKDRGDPTDIWKNLPPEWKKPPPIYPDGKPPPGPAQTMFDEPTSTATDFSGARRLGADGKPIPVVSAAPLEVKTPEQKALAAGEAGTDAVPRPKEGEVKPAPTDLASQITGAASAAGAAIAAPIIAAGPALGAGIGEQLAAASATFASTFASVGSQLATAGQALAAGGQQAASAIQSGASAAGSAYGAAAAAKISAAVANVSINVNHTGSAGGTGGSPGPVKEA